VTSHCCSGDVYVLTSTGMICLLNVYKNKKDTIAEDCGKMLDERISLWQLVITVRTQPQFYATFAYLNVRQEIGWL